MTDIYLEKNLKILRERKGISKEELGRRVGVSGVTIGYWESGQTTPRMGKVEKVSQALGVTVDELLFENFSSSPSEKAINNLDLNVSPDQRRAIELIMGLDADDLKMFITLMERSVNGEN
ncbi:helix-turn-helix domain-containing protein [Sinorhizobium medicae]|nr:helix-turn-helix domain-containing protein [Sinorhizobium medicae]